MALTTSRNEISARMEAILAYGVWHPQEFEDALDQLVAIITTRLPAYDARVIGHVEVFVRHNAEQLLLFQTAPDVIADRLAIAWHHAGAGPHRLSGAMTRFGALKTARRRGYLALSG